MPAHNERHGRLVGVNEEGSNWPMILHTLSFESERQEARQAEQKRREKEMDMVQFARIN